MKKEYKIKTLKEVLKVVNVDNVENFLKDFENWLRLSVNIKSLQEVFKDEAEIEHNDFFHWFDDKKNNCEINLKIKEKD